MNKVLWLCLICCLFCASPVVSQAAGDSAGENTSIPAVLPVPGTVTMIDLGAHSCIPCKMMAPIMDKMEKRYADRAAIVFIDVWEHREEASKYGIRAIPTQIFYDHTGKEVFRHQGFFPEESIVHILDKLLAAQEGN